MTIVRWNPYREIAAMQRALNRVFDENWTNDQSEFNTQALALDVHETPADYKVTTALPGVKADNIEISYLDRTLTINAEIPQPTVAEGSKSLINERFYGKFTRSVTLVQPVNADAIEAEYKEGVLHLTLPKTEAAKPRQIPVRGTITGNNSSN